MSVEFIFESCRGCGRAMKTRGLKCTRCGYDYHDEVYGNTLKDMKSVKRKLKRYSKEILLKYYRSNPILLPAGDSEPHIATKPTLEDSINWLNKWAKKHDILVKYDKRFYILDHIRYLESGEEEFYGEDALAVYVEEDPCWFPVEECEFFTLTKFKL